VASFAFTDAPFEHAGSIPIDHTGDGADVSPPLAWTAPPEGTESLILVVDDPDAPGPGSVTHWVVYNLPPVVTTVPRDYRPDASRLVDADPVAHAGVNDFGDQGYSGPCPPPGKEHRYLFSIYALDTVLDLAPEPGPMQVVAAMMNHVLDKAVRIGTYRRDENASAVQGSRGAQAAV
jgi:Raf kinase inhibitor-like YbhB/YbcL family protein